MFISEVIESALRHKRSLLQTYSAQVQRKILFLKSHFGSDLHDAIRLQRIIELYKAWQEILNRCRIQSPKNISEAMKIRALLTYEKKAFLKKQLEVQTIRDIVQALDRLVNDGNLSSMAHALCNQLKKSKKTLKMTIRQRESQLKEKPRIVRCYRDFLSMLLLGITHHPEYQMGQLAARFGDKAGESSRIPILREKLPDGMKSKLEHTTHPILNFLAE